MTVGEFFERAAEAAGGGEFADLGLLAGDPGEELRSVEVGIEVGSREVERAARSRQRGGGPSLLLSHHFSQLVGPEVDVRRVLERQREALQRAGVPDRRAHELVAELARRREAALGGGEPLRLARRLGVPLGIAHTPADLLAERHLRRLIESSGPQTLADLLEALRPVPEFREAERRGERLTIVAGSPDEPVGEIFYCVSIGWNPLPEAFEELARAGRARTVVTTSATPEVIGACRRAGLNLVEIPHYGADSLGLNLLLNSVLPGDVEVRPLPDFIRVERRRGAG